VITVERSEAMTPLDRRACAVLMMDFQADIVGRLGDAATPVLDRAAGVLSAARSARVPVIYVVVGFRPGYPEVSARNQALGAVVQSGRLITVTPGSDVDPKLKPAVDDIVVLKHRVSAFAGTDLDMVLRANSIGTLILLGLSTSGVVLSTVRHAADADYRIIVASDACGDSDAEVHRVLMEKVFPRQATVLVSAQVIQALQ
jgi:nicotinamidase-related amidase